MGASATKTAGVASGVGSLLGGAAGVALATKGIPALVAF
jgi:hypothetical protein